MLKTEVTNKAKLAKQWKMGQEQKQIEHGRKIAEFYDDIEVMEA